MFEKTYYVSVHTKLGRGGVENRFTRNLPHPIARKVIKTLSLQLARNQGRDDNETHCHLQRLGILLHRGNVFLILNISPSFPSQEIDRVAEDKGLIPSNQ